MRSLLTTLFRHRCMDYLHNAAKAMGHRLVIEDNRLFISGVEFRLEDGRRPHDSGDGALFLHKTVAQIELYEDFWKSRPSFHPERLFELGIWEGGSVAFWFEYFRPLKHVAVDVLPSQDRPALEHYLSTRKRHNQIGLHWSIDQEDGEALSRIVAREFDEPLDLVIDDASHLYGPTKASFQTLFPLLRSCGLYIIEDWPWAYDARYRAPGHPWADEQPLTDLAVSLLELAGKGIVRSLFVNPGFIAIERGDPNADDPDGFRLTENPVR